MRTRTVDHQALTLLLAEPRSNPNHGRDRLRQIGHLDHLTERNLVVDALQRDRRASEAFGQRALYRRKLVGTAKVSLDGRDQCVEALSDKLGPQACGANAGDEWAIIGMRARAAQLRFGGLLLVESLSMATGNQVRPARPASSGSTRAGLGPRCRRRSQKCPARIATTWNPVQLLAVSTVLQGTLTRRLQMAKTRRSPKRNVKTAALALGAAGVSLAMTGGASATAPMNVASQDNARRIFLGEEEIADVSLATFHVFDRESESRVRQGIRVAAGCGGHGCGGCGHGGGCGCAHAGGCGCAHIGGCAGGCGFRGCAGGCGCRGCGGCRCGGCGLGGLWLGITCLGCAACTGSCLQWDPYLGRWISVCY